MANTPTQLLSEANCFSCIPTGSQGAVSIYLLMQIAGLDMTPTQLLSASSCFNCIPAGQQPAVQTYLLDQIVSGGGGGGSGVTCSDAAPVGAPTGTCGLHYDRLTGQLWAWNDSTASWDLYLS